MSKLLHSREDISKVLDCALVLVSELTFHGISKVQQEEIVRHFIELRTSGKTIDAGCRLSASHAGRTEITIILEPKDPIQ